MNLVDLHNKLAQQVELLTQENVPYAKRKADAEIAMTVSSLAKQIINNADVVLRAEKLAGDGKLKGDSRVMEIVNGTGYGKNKLD